MTKCLKMLLPVATLILSLPGCDGIFDGMYATPAEDDGVEYGFTVAGEDGRSGRIYVDATDYAEWHYIDLRGKTVTTCAVGAEAPEVWDFAIHRYDAKTNGGAVCETDADDVNELPDMGAWETWTFAKDVWTTDRITVDMSQMMDGIVVYAEDDYNECLSRWLDVDTSVMPPIYTLSGKVYVLQSSDGRYAALRLANFMNDAAVKGFMTIDYVYPIEL